MDTTRPSLLRRIRERDNVEAWAEFTALYRPMLMRFSLARGVGEVDADDAAQHCLTVVMNRISSFDYDRRRGGFKRWLRTLVKNRIHNLRRDRRELSAHSDLYDREQQREESGSMSTCNSAFSACGARCNRRR